jgi:hypothetical protein
LLGGHAEIEHRDVDALAFGLRADGQNHSLHEWKYSEVHALVIVVVLAMG